MIYPMPIPPDEALGLPIDRLALRILRLESDQDGSPNRHNFLNGAEQNYQRNGVPNRRKVVEALAEGYDWLLRHGLVSKQLGRDTWMFITRKGHAVLEAEDGLALVQAEASDRR